MDESKCSDRIIPYKGSPTGEAYVGVAKKPLMKNKKFGFQGVLLQDSKRELVQCSSCGKWFKRITKGHLKNCCGLEVQDYKAKF